MEWLPPTAIIGALGVLLPWIVSVHTRLARLETALKQQSEQLACISQQCTRMSQFIARADAKLEDLAAQATNHETRLRNVETGLKS